MLGAEVPPQDLDVQTVRSLHVLMPAVSTNDSRTIRRMMHDHKAFPDIRRPSTRRKLESRALSCERILTLGSFQADTIWLQRCYEPLRDLFSDLSGTTLREKASNRSDAGGFRLNAKCFAANYLELWLYSTREQDSVSLKKRRKREQSISCLDTSGKMVRLASFAASRGFWSFRISELLKQQRVSLSPPHLSTDKPELSCDEADIAVRHRCGRPCVQDHQRGWAHLNLANVFYSPLTAAKRYPTSFAVARHFVHSFWEFRRPYEDGHGPQVVQHADYPAHRQNADAHEQRVCGESLLQETNGSETDLAVERCRDLVAALRPPSSIYGTSNRAPSDSTSPQHNFNGDGVAWSERDFIEDYINPFGNSVPFTYRRGNYGSRDLDEVDLPIGRDSDWRVSPGLWSDNDNDPSPLHGAEVSKQVVQTARNDAGEDDDDAIMEDFPSGTASTSDGPRSNEGHLGTATSLHKIAPRRNEVDPRDAVESQTLQQAVNGPEPSSGISHPAGYGDEARFANGGEARSHLEHNSNSENATMAETADDPGSSISEGEDDVQRGTREAMEHMRSAEDAAGEIMDDSGPSSGAEAGAEHPDSIVGTDGIRDRFSLFPGVSGNAKTNIKESRPAPSVSTKVWTFRKMHANSKREHASKREGILAVQVSEPSVDRTDLDQSSARTDEPSFVIPDDIRRVRSPKWRTDRPQSSFPGLHSHLPRSEGVRNALPTSNGFGSSTSPRRSLSAAKQSLVAPASKVGATDARAIGTRPPITRRRKLNEMETEDVHIRPSKERDLAQLECWESFKRDVDSVEKMRNDMEENVIYVKGTVGVGILVQREHPTERHLWSWTKAEQHEFDAQLGPLLREGYRLQVVISDRQSAARQYRTVSHMEYWHAHFTNGTLNWLAVLSPRLTDRHGPEKIRKTKRV